jgi:hypothetical protein
MMEGKKQLSRPLAGVLILAMVTALMPFAGAQYVTAQTTTEVFINEIHYDNASTDAGEAIEIAGPAGTDLTGWSVVLYNGSNGLVYDTDPLSGTATERSTSPIPSTVSRTDRPMGWLSWIRATP